MAGQGYNLDYTTAQGAAKGLNDLIGDFTREIQTMNSIESEMLSDANWKGDNKTNFTARFAEYKQAIENLRSNAQEHYEVLMQILQTYAAAEQ